MNKLAILERDGWKCQLCGVDTPRSLRGTTHPHAPEVGHIVPKCRGGTDDPQNLRCECKACNHKKAGLLDGECGEFRANGEPIDAVAILASSDAIHEGARKGALSHKRRSTPEKLQINSDACRRGGLIGGRRVHELHPEIAKRAALLAGHKYWHIRRGIVNPNCPLCNPSVENTPVVLQTPPTTL